MLPTYKSLDLNINYDDGFVAYLNGTEIARRNAALAAQAAIAGHGELAVDELKEIDDMSDEAARVVPIRRGQTRDVYARAATRR